MDSIDSLEDPHLRLDNSKNKDKSLRKLCKLAQKLSIRLEKDHSCEKLFRNIKKFNSNQRKMKIDLQIG